jgi:glyoxylase-like metal-dependent hydrolase (beta-lactamase superfamily II)
MVEMGASWEDYSDAIGIRWALPDITFLDGLSLHWGGGEVLVEHHPGPTAGACWVTIPSEKIIFVGDALVVGQTPFLANAELVPWLESLEILLKRYRDYILVAGRGGVATTEDVKIVQKGLKKTLRSMDRLAKRRAAPEATENLIESLMEEFELPGGGRHRDVIRLKYGLYQYYIKSYRPSDSAGDLRLDADDL